MLSDKDKYWLDIAHALLAGSAIQLKHAHAKYNSEHDIKPDLYNLVEFTLLREVKYEENTLHIT